MDLNKKKKKTHADKQQIMSETKTGVNCEDGCMSSLVFYSLYFLMFWFSCVVVNCSFQAKKLS